MALMLLVPSWSLLLYLLVLVPIWLVGVVVYRLYFHPLAHIPGPRVAAVTYLYSFYFGALVGSGGQFYRQIENLHREYGPVVRITPDEVHLSDPENYDVIYHVGTEYWKHPGFYETFGLDTSSFAAISNELHRVRRAALNPRFSRKAVLELEEVVHSKAQKLCNGVEDALRACKPADLHHGFRAVSVDVITDYAFDNCYNLLDRPGFGTDHFNTMNSLLRTFPLFLQFPSIGSVARNSPAWLVKRLSRSIGSYLRRREECQAQVAAVKASLDAPEAKPPSRMTIFHQLLQPSLVEGHEVPSVEELVDEAFAITNAASDTTGNALTISTYHILSKDEIRGKLTTELKEAFANPSSPLDFITLEKLPYLTGVVKEGLRLSYGTLSRLPRVTPPPGAVFNGYVIPPGSIVGMSSWMMHRNEVAFPAPEKFNPARWIGPETAKKLDKYLVPFSKGSRQCLGRNLAYCELYITLATFFRRFENLEVYKTRPEDLVYDDYFAPTHPPGANILHVVSRER